MLDDGAMRLQSFDQTRAGSVVDNQAALAGRKYSTRYKDLFTLTRPGASIQQESMTTPYCIQSLNAGAQPIQTRCSCMQVAQGVTGNTIILRI